MNARRTGIIGFFAGPVIVVAGMLAVCAPSVRAEEGPPKHYRAIDSTGGPYCGIYSLYAALRVVGVETRFEDLVQKKYVGAKFGSSLAELRQAALENGAHARPVEGLSATTLRAVNTPIILHVRRPGRNMPYLHWVLFLGVDGDNALIVDPPFDEERISFSELLALWDGVGLVVSRQPITRGQLFWSSWVEQGILVALVAALIGGARLLARRGRAGTRGRLKAAGRYALRIVGLAGGAALLAGLWHAVHDEGFRGNRPALALVAGQHFDVPHRIVTVEQIATIQSEAGVTVIDARLPRDYASGHIPTAVSLPITAGLAERGQVLANVPPTNRVVVYCQSEACVWGDAIATDLVLRGYPNVAVFRGGYREWVTHERRKSD